MAADQNKDVVRRFITEILVGGDLERVDDLIAPTYRNKAFDMDAEAFKGMLAGLAAALPDRRFDVQELVAEGEVVVARFTAEMRDTSGNTIPFRGLTYYRLADGRIVEDDPITSPDLGEALAPLMSAPSA
jgi:predicted ester cyclase